MVKIRGEKDGAILRQRVEAEEPEKSGGEGGRQLYGPWNREGGVKKRRRGKKSRRNREASIVFRTG